MGRFRKFLAADCGASSIEYALISALIAIVILASVLTLGHSTSTMYTSVSNSL